MALGSWFTLAWYGPAAAAIVDSGTGTQTAAIKGDARPAATLTGVGTIIDADATRLVNSPATIVGTGSLVTAAPRGDARPSLMVSIGSRPSATDIAEAVVAQRVHPLGDDSTIGDVLALLVDAGPGGGGVIDVDAVAAAVWDRVMSAHDLDGSFGQRLRELFPQHWGVE